MRWTIERKLGALLLGWLLLGGTAGALFSRLTGSFALVLLGTAAVGLIPTLLLANRSARPVQRCLRAITGMVASYRDGELNQSLRADRNDELGDLLAAHNKLAAALREQHTNLVQRELLLDTITHHSPMGLVLVDAHEHVAYANIAAAHLLDQGRRLAGQDFQALLDRAPEQLRTAARSSDDCLCSCEIRGMEETYHIARQTFQLQGRQHRLYLFKRLTRELSRQELFIWKKLIRVLSHELNNSLAPIASLAQSGSELAQRRQVTDLMPVFSAISERTEHLHRFLLGYAELAKLPAPQPRAVDWRPLIEEVAAHQPCRLEGCLPQTPGWFDRAQIAQALLNLLKNANEAGGGHPVEISVTAQADEHRIEVCDRGPGMSPTVMSQALLPFYSTKPQGTGLGLALVRDIAEAHGGRIRLSNREGGGLCATLILPAPAPTSRSSTEPSARVLSG